jgi:Leucine-rich repeat (LRR) protein
LADLDPLRNLTKLTHLVLLENPVTRKEVSILIHTCTRKICVRADDFVWLIVLPALDNLADSQRPLPRLPESERCGTS